MDDQFTKLFTYMQSEFGKLRDDLESTRTELKADIDRVYNLLDQHAKQQEIDRQERQVMHYQLTQHDKWIDQAAKRIGVNYNPC